MRARLWTGREIQHLKRFFLFLLVDAQGRAPFTGVSILLRFRETLVLDGQGFRSGGRKSHSDGHILPLARRFDAGQRSLAAAKQLGFYLSLLSFRLLAQAGVSFRQQIEDLRVFRLHFRYRLQRLSRLRKVAFCDLRVGQA